MISEKDFLFILRCFDLARLGVGSTSPNPSVGSVIVAPNGEIIGEGWHQKYGLAHAEVNAVASVQLANRNRLKESTIYVSLEPCFHVGKTGPCVELILKERIPRVVIASVDPFPLVAGKSIEKLRQNGVEVLVFQSNTENFYKHTEGEENVDISDLLIKEKYTLKGRNILLNDKIPAQFTIQMPFFTNVSKRRPYVILKWAESADGFMGRVGEETPISNAYAKRLTHKWRSECDAILVGTETALVDNPELTNRHYFGKSPVRVALDRQGRLPKTAHLLDGAVKTLVYTDASNQNIGSESLEFRSLNFDENPLENLLSDLFEQKIGTLFVEGGQRLLQSFISTKLCDEIRVFRAPTVLGSGVSAPKIEILKFCQIVQLIDNQLLIFRNF